MPYTHGVYIQENPTSIIAPMQVDSAVQFIVGTAPINLLGDPAGAVNKLLLVTSYAEAVTKAGFSYSFDKFTICQAIYVSFKVFNVQPLVLVNVLDPAKHFTAVVSESHDIVSGEVLVKEEGILLDVNFVVKNSAGTTTYVKDTDYTIAFDDDGYVLLKVKSTGSIGTETKLSLSYHQLDPSAVTKEDIIGGYEAATGKYTGIELISQVYPKLGITPGLIVCPGWSHIVAVGTAMTAKTTGLNGVFKCMAVKDIPTADVVEYSACNEWKSKNAYTDKHDIVCWPKVVVGDYQLYFSAVLAALIAYTDNENGGVPYVSPSNKQFRITGTVLADGTEVYLDQLQANILNGQGIVTAINIAGTWKCWGNNTGIYPVSTDVKDRFMPCRRMFVWWGNTFIQTYFQKVDDPMNKRLIEAIVDSENIRANGYKAKFQLADARIVYIPDENPTTDLLNGKIVFHQYLTPFPPAETIIDILEFDPDAFTASLS